MAFVRSTADGATVTPKDSKGSKEAKDLQVEIPANPREDGPGWQGLRSLTATAGGRTLQILIDDVDPYRMPGSANLAVRPASARVDRWQTMLDCAWEQIARDHEVLAEEIATAIRVFTPLMSPLQGQVSATSRETFGAIALSEPPNPCSLAVTLAHEIQHAKLSALLDIVPLTMPDDGRRYYAPWRDDPRPVAGLLQGAYAFLGVTGFWRRQARLEAGKAKFQACTEFARWRSAVRLVVDTLTSSGRLTGPGMSFVSGMARTLQAYETELVSTAAVTVAQRAVDEHKTRWRRRNGDSDSWSWTRTVRAPRPATPEQDDAESASLGG
jgi:HEXXH motif-containing protein